MQCSADQTVGSDMLVRQEVGVVIGKGHWGFDVLGPVLDAPATCAETDIEKGSVESTHKRQGTDQPLPHEHRLALRAGRCGLPTVLQLSSCERLHSQLLNVATTDEL